MISFVAIAHILVASATNRTKPTWPYAWDKFPAFWFGANASGFENDSQMELLAKYSMVLFGWQHLQLATNYSNLLHAQIEQARRVKKALPATPVWVYMPVADAQPFYAAQNKLFKLQAPFYAEEYANFFFLGAEGELYPNTTSHKCNDETKLYPTCINSMWNFFNASAKDFFLNQVIDVQLGLDAQDLAFDGVFFDASTTFMRAEGDMGTKKVWRGAANLPASVSNSTVLAIEAEIIAGLVEKAAKHGKYPAFNSRLLDMSFSDGREPSILDRVGSGGMMRYYDLSNTILDRDLIDNALAERKQAGLMHLFPVRTPPSSTNEEKEEEIAAFLLIRGEYDYFTFHSSYYDAGFEWHPQFDIDYGIPLGDAVVSTGATGKAKAYARNYTKCSVKVTCAANQNRCKGHLAMHG